MDLDKLMTITGNIHSQEVVGNCNVQMLESGPFIVSQGPMEQRKTSRRSFSSDLFRIGACISGRQQGATMHTSDLFMVGDHWTSVADCQWLNNTMNWRKSSATLYGSHSDSFESGQNLLVSRFSKLFLKTLRQGKSKRKLWGLDRPGCGGGGGGGTVQQEKVSDV